MDNFLFLFKPDFDYNISLCSLWCIAILKICCSWRKNFWIISSYHPYSFFRLLPHPFSKSFIGSKSNLRVIKVTILPPNKFCLSLHLFGSAYEGSMSVKNEYLIWENTIFTEKLTFREATAHLGRCIFFQSFAKTLGGGRWLSVTMRCFCFVLTKGATFKTSYGEDGKKVAFWFVNPGSIFWIEKERVILPKEISIKPTA